MRKRKNLCRRFTLLELLISLSVFVVIFAIMARFLAGGQTLWRTTEQQNEVYAEGRIAMNLITLMLQDIQSDAGLPCVMQTSETNPMGISFFTRSPMDYPCDTTASPAIHNKGTLRPVRFYLNYSTHELHLYGLSETGCTSYFQYTSTTVPVVATLSVGTGYDNVIAERVFQFDVSLPSGIPAVAANTAPLAIKIDLGILSKKDKERYDELSGDAQTEFKKEHLVTFSRVIHLLPGFDLSTR